MKLALTALQVRLLIALMLLPMLGGFATTASAQPQKQIALTFDDAPRGDGPVFSGMDRTKQIIAALKSAKVRQAAIFVHTGNLTNPDGEARLRLYTAAGHVLGNHSHSHTWLRRTEPAAYLADVDIARGYLARFEKVRPWFRYPYLDEGRDEQSRDFIRSGLVERGLRNGYVTVDTYDWAIDALFRKARNSNQVVDMQALGELYVEAIMSAVEFYDKVGVEALGRSPAHVLLLHENDMAALFVDDLVRELRGRGWSIVSPDEAYADPIAEDVPDTLFNGQGRVAAFAYLKGRKPAELIDRYQDEQYLAELFNDRVLRQAAQPTKADR